MTYANCAHTDGPGVLAGTVSEEAPDHGIACGPVLAFVSDGASNRSLTILFIVVLNLLIGAGMSHATGRAFMQRGEA